MGNFIESARNRFQEWRRKREIESDPAATFLLGEYKEHGGLILGGEGEPYRLKVTPDGMEIMPQDGGLLAGTDPEAEKANIQGWIQNYGIQAILGQRYLRVALGLPADLPDETKAMGTENQQK